MVKPRQKPIVTPMVKYKRILSKKIPKIIPIDMPNIEPKDIPSAR